MEISKELAEQVLKMLKATEVAAGQAADFAKQQIPDVVNQLVHWKIATAIAGMVISIIFISLIFYAKFVAPKIVKARDKKREKCKGYYFDDSGYQVGIALVWATALVSLVGGTIGFCCNLYTLLQLIFAPKIYLIEYLTQLVQGTPK